VSIRLSFLAGLLALAIPAAAQTTPDQAAQNSPAQDRAADVKLAFARAEHLKHGINASSWFAQSGDYSAKATDSYTDDADIALMAKMGFDHVRLSIDPMPLAMSMFGRPGPNNDFLARLDHAVDTMLANHLAVIIDLHPSDDYKQKMRSDDQAVERFTMLWRRLAEHEANRDPNMVFFEILNEPEIGDDYRWAGIQMRVEAAIREAAPHHTIIAAGAMWSDIWNLLAMQPLADGNVIYNFHFYEPHEFTHQGATWSVPYWSYLHGVPYPGTESAMQDVLGEVPDAVERYDMQKYFLDDWNAHRIQVMIDDAAAWAREHHVPLTCNEFGVIRGGQNRGPDPASRANWLHDVRTALENDGIGWAMWDYRGGFGVVTKQDGQPAVVDENTAHALGLK
jgi:aryl-phospho-beta-D-glucosidase BglC (GH1 family)